MAISDKKFNTRKGEPDEVRYDLRLFEVDIQVATDFLSLSLKHMRGKKGESGKRDLIFIPFPSQADQTAILGEEKK